MRKLSISKREYGNPINSILVHEFEKEMGFKLSVRYKNFIVQYDGKRLVEDCFDYSKDPTSSEPAVVVVFHDDVYIDENGEQKMVVNHVANSFGEFVDLLYEYQDPDITYERIEIEI